MTGKFKILTQAIIVGVVGFLYVTVGWAVPTATTAQTPASNNAKTRPGEELYWRHCATCHETGAPKAPTRHMLSFMSPTSIYNAITDGLMRAQAEKLSSAQKHKVVEFLTGRPVSSESKAEIPVCQGDALKFDVNQPPSLQGWGFTPGNRREIPNAVAGIDRGNVDRLVLQWVFAFPDAVRARSHPAAAAGAVFVGSQDGTVYALDRESGCVRWQYQARAEVRTGIVVSSWKTGDTEADPLLFFGDYLGNIYAVHAFTGEAVWTARPDAHQNATITAAPTLFEDRLYVSVSSLEAMSAAEPSYKCCTFRGSVAAYNARTGEQLWKSYTITETLSVQGKNAIGVDQIGPSGAPIWNTPSIDPKRRILYVGTGENYSSPASDTSDAILALSMDDGRIKWRFQATANDAWNMACVLPDRTNCPQEDGPDFDFGGATILARGADGRELVLAGQKSGMVWALDPDDGSLIWKNRVGRGGVIGGVHFGMAVSGTKLIVPISDALADPAFRSPYSGKPNPGLFALDIATGKFIWRWEATDECEGLAYCMPGNSAVPTATPELVIAGSLDGRLRIHDVETGKILWKYNTVRDYKNTVSGVKGRGGALEGGAAALLDGGMMFVNSGYLFNKHLPGNVLLAFKIVPGSETETMGISNGQ